MTYTLPTRIDISFEWLHVFNALSDMAMILDTDHTILAVNSTIEKLTGMKQHELIGVKCYEVFHCSDYPPESCPILPLRVSKATQTADVRMEALGGVYLVSASPVLDHEGNIRHILYVAKDITRRKKKEESLRRKNRTLASIRECHKAIVRIKDEQKLMDRLCEILVRLNGYRLVWIGVPLNDPEKSVKPLSFYGIEEGYLSQVVIRWGDDPLSNGPTGTAIRTGVPVVCQDFRESIRFNPWLAPAIQRGYASSLALPLVTETECLGVLNLYSAEINAFNETEIRLLEEFTEDLTFGLTALRTEQAHEAALTALKSSEMKYRMLIETANDAIFTADAETGVIIDANKAAAILIDRPLNEIIGMHHAMLHPENEYDRYRRIFSRHVHTKKIASEDVFVVNRSGRRIPVQISANTLEIGGKKLIQGVFRDITELKTVEEHLRQAQKMEAIGTLAGGIAHDFNNILSPILGYTELAMLQTDAESQIHSDLKAVLSAARRAKSLVQQILTFSRKGVDETAPLKLNPMIKESIRFLRSSIPKTIEFRETIDPECGYVLCDPTQIHQIVMNLITNAYQALPDETGVIDISLTPFVADQTKNHRLNPPISGNYVKLSIRDSGEGIPASHIDRIFDPYFTTKEKDKGTGLGLAVVHGIVQMLSGYIEVSSEPGKGTTFDIFLKTIKPDEVKKERVTDASPKGGSEQILVVDDDDPVLNITGRMIRDLGYETTVFSESPQALSTFRENPHKFDLVVTDRSMPQLSGTALAKKIREIRPDIPIILLTGFSSKATEENKSLYGISEFLLKPVNREELARAIRLQLDGKKER